MSKDKDNSPNCNVVCSISSYSDTRPSTNNKTVSYDPSAYIQKVRTTRAAPPKPAYDPLQFVQSKPCNLVKSAQEQAKKVETIKNLKDDKIDEPEEWQCNLDNWKSSRRKRVEHIIDRVVEVKKIELEEHNRQRRKSKTFNEMIEERNSRRHIPLPIYTDDDNDLTDLGICSPDSSSKINPNVTRDEQPDSNPTTTIDLSEYTYEGAIEDYKSRISRAGHGVRKSEINQCKQIYSDENHNVGNSYAHKLGVNTKNDEYKDNTLLSDMPKIDILKRKELFEKEQINCACENKRHSTDFVNTVSMRERLSQLQLCQTNDSKENENDIGIINSRTGIVRSRSKLFEAEITSTVGNPEMTPKDSINFSSSAKHNNIQGVVKDNNPAALESITNSVSVENIANDSDVTERSSVANMYDTILTQHQIPEPTDIENVDTDHEDSGVHTTDVSCSVSQTEDQNDEIGQHIEATATIKLNAVDDSDETIFLRQRRNVEKTYVIDADNFIQVDSDDANNDNVLDDALEIAFQQIDNMDGIDTQTKQSTEPEPIYHNIMCNQEGLSHGISKPTNDVEPYYQVPKVPHEPFYEVPKTIPLYENIAMFHPTLRKEDTTANDGLEYTIRMHNPEPPKEKPPPPPVHYEDAALGDNSFSSSNSTNRIKNTIRSKRSSFLAMDAVLSLDETSNELDAASSPSVHSTLHNEQLKSSLYDNYEFAESRDSGMSENHSRQSSDLFTTSSDDPEYNVKSKDNETHIVCRNYPSTSFPKHELFQQNIDSGTKYQSYNKQLVEHLRVITFKPNTIGKYHEADETLAALGEACSMPRCNIDLTRSLSGYGTSVVTNPENIQLIEPPITICKAFMKLSLTKSNSMKMNLGLDRVRFCVSKYPDWIKSKDNETHIVCRNYPSTSFPKHELFQQNIDSGTKYQSYNKQLVEHLHSDDTPFYVSPEEQKKIHYDYDKELTNFVPSPIPPAKPVRCLRCQQYSSCAEHQKLFPIEANLHYDRVDPNKISLCESQVAYHNACNNINLLTDSLLLLHGQTRTVNIPPKITASNVSSSTSNINDWNQYHVAHDDEKGKDIYHDSKSSVQRRNTEFSHHWNIKSTRQLNLHNNSRNHHWLVQEADHRRNEQQTSIHTVSDPFQNKKANRKSLPDSVIQTITQRVQNLGIGVDRRWQHDVPNMTYEPTIEGGTKSSIMNTQSNPHLSENGEKIISVSGKKKCSHCQNELGRGAAMVIESLGLLYHIDCFKCCVCHTRLGDGFKGTDVRVRKYKLHCQNCFSSEDGVKFSCV
ncbi:uncharacterized protein LOC129773836 [Toxorhynchites rutilus septentrionalis]|uniref:uncharacterized protein LOC129773836 n=1 Tax=Toxorhynchites rutilus septentrionalis TaxID=329112 RepID=UPI0024790C4B|nr:uncharacterized protein LOC129773836 [Toxorhynchites rutilus septentrionalis]